MTAASLPLTLYVEVQSQEEGGFAQRMYIYNYRIFDQFGRDVVSLAVLGDERATWRPTQYTRSRWGCRVEFTFPMVKLADYRVRRAELEGNANPFATVVLAHLAAQDTRGDVVGRAQMKLALTRRLYEQGYGRERILSLYRFIDWLLELPPQAEAQLRQEIRKLEEERRMPYITSIERMGHAEGLQEGRAEGTREALRRLVRARFGAVPAPLEARIAAADQEMLDHLVDRAATVQSVEDL